ncbi:N-acetylmuramoyl-L-alanine amidase [Vagococcus sp. DIV0080]|uniref:N-acetylmuramoyl-L-alanine amidase n=1 Tax=Candidatus Vagococcus giribetii TaxID=2230876 RepID=A0ABS3HVV7_9ENTE|nr:N-acetylmuramoyl-L-alanine amidase [Vagococcus sp. DIV0080]MBO0477886.1 N-acetylmuramoyl-L-alanine amidase [Vagococcus sp. DIV0080]
MLKFKDASDFKGRNVEENLYNIKLNSDRLSDSSDIILSIHFNGFNEKATGTETWSYLGDSISKPIAQKLSREIASAQGIVDRGQKSTTNLYVVSQTKAHMILIEVCFLDNYTEINNYIKNKNKVINAILKVCESYPQYNFTATHGGHYGLGMMDPGVSRHGFKEAVLAQEINQALLKNKKIHTNPSKPAPTAKPQEKNYYQSGHYFEALQDLKTYNKTFSKVDKTWLFKKGTRFAVREIIKMPNGATHAQVAGLGNTYVTLSKKHVKPQ